MSATTEPVRTTSVSIAVCAGLGFTPELHLLSLLFKLHRAMPSFSIMACMRDEDRVVIYNARTAEQKTLDHIQPYKCAASHKHIALTSMFNEPLLFERNGEVLQYISHSKTCEIMIFHPTHPNIVALGGRDQNVFLWNMKHRYPSFLAGFGQRISAMAFTTDGRLIAASDDKTAKIITFELNKKFKALSTVNLKGHTGPVTDIVHLPSSNQCVTSSDDKTVKVWNSQTGACLRTLTEHAGPVTALAVSVNENIFASGSLDRSVILWASESLKILHRVSLWESVLSLVFGRGDVFFAGVQNHGVFSCNSSTGSVGALVIPARGSIPCLALSTLNLLSS